MITMGGTVGKAFKKGQRRCKKSTGWDLKKLTTHGGWVLIDELFHLCAVTGLSHLPGMPRLLRGSRAIKHVLEDIFQCEVEGEWT